jgi:TonB-linked SusC/RagA family outer membrane protein
MKRILLMCLAVVFLAGLTTTAWAQDRTVSGRVTSADDGSGAPGVSIMLEGTTIGAQTDGDGRYTLSVPSTGGVLVFSFIGYTTQSISIGTQSVIDVVLQPDTKQLEEIVVVGYGTTTKEAFVGSAKSVSSRNIETKSFTNLSQAMAGEVAGVNVINTSGQPGTVATVRIRGLGSVNGNRNPLYVVDGIPLTDAGSLNAINNADITSYTVLKDATATAIYGARGANGVIVITTRGGQKGKSSIDVEYKTGVNMSLLPRYDVIESPEEYIELTWEGMKNRGVSEGELNPAAYASNRLFNPTGGIQPKYNMWNVADGNALIDPATGRVRAGVTRKYNPEDWEDYGFQSSQRHEGNVRFSGGSERSTHYLSFGYLKDIGYIVNSDFSRYSLRSNLQHKVTNWLTANANVGLSTSDQNTNGQSSDSGSIFWFVDNIPSIYPLFERDVMGNRIANPYYGGYVYDYGVGRGFGALTNSIGDAHIQKVNTKNNELVGNVSMNVDFTDYLSFETRYGVQYSTNNFTNLESPFYGSSATAGGSLFRTLSDNFTQNFLQMLRFNKTFGLHSVEALAAHESNQWRAKISSASKRSSVDPFIDDFNNFIIVNGQPSGYTQGSALESYFAQLNYNFDGRYFFSGSIRRDGSSRFINDKWGTFGSVGAAWIINKESFWQFDVVNHLKLKASYGLTGEQAGVGLYPGYNTFDISNLNDEISLTPRDNGTPDLTWETSKMFQAGLEFELFSGRIEALVDYYNKTTDGLLFDRRVGPSQGIAVITVNDGLLVNKGIEFDITTHILNEGDFKLDFSVNGAFNTNEIKRMPIDPATGKPKIIDTSTGYGMAEGHSIFDFYTREWAGVDPADGNGMWYQYYNDLNDDGVLNAGEEIASMAEYEVPEGESMNLKKTTTKDLADATFKYVGKSAIPKLRGGFRLTAMYKGFDISAQFVYGLGGYGYDGAYATLMANGTAGANNWHTDVRKRWQQPGDITDVPRLSDGYDVNGNGNSTRFLTKANFLSLNNIKVGYSVPVKLLAYTKVVTGVNIWVSGDNLMLLSHRKGFNPSTSEVGGSSMYRYSPLSTLSAGLRVTF